MPSGFTSGVQDGTITTLEEFALLCTRGMGVCITMRDEPLGVEIPEFQPDTYHAKAVEDVKAKIANLEAMTDDEVQAMLAEETAQVLNMKQESRQRSQENRKRYEDMLGKVFLWNPPTPEHQGLRAYMESQLRESLQFDCHGEDFYERCYILPPQDVAEYREKKMAKYRDDYAYHSNHHHEEVQRTEERNRWVRQLRESLKQHKAILEPTT